MAKYALDNAWERAKRRLTLLEQHLDPMTERRLAMLGVDHGWSALEVGGGGGSIAQWLCRQVGTDGHVTATDIDIRLPFPRWWLNEDSPTWVVKGTSLFSVADLRWRSFFS